MIYKELSVYKKAYQLALGIHKLSLRFPKIEQFELASQLRRSSKSIVANLVEGLSRQSSKADGKRFLRIAIGSCDESRLWLEFAKDLKYIDKSMQASLEARSIEIGKMLQGLIKRRNIN